MKNLLSTLAIGTVTASVASAQINVASDITTSTTWTANNVYSLTDDIYVRNGATLTIEPGTVIASNAPGSLVIARGSQLIAQGTADQPIIFTSTADRATWTAGDPTTGTWRPSAFEWGNVTIMGEAYVSENATPGNSATPSASNFALMEGLVAGADPTLVRYGAGDDDDSSGILQYVSFRYGGRDLDPGNELNGLSLGGLGRGTVIDHVEIMNNVDDGIEIWGGTVDVKYFSIWNVGDDSFDIDQGWRGRAQFGLIVQGYSLAASQGSGVGDNAIELDGAEDSDWQPVTTATMYNMTVIGNPLGGDGLTAWRDGARVQIRQSIFMDGGEQVVRPDGDDGDGASGYGHNGTLTFAQVWQTPATQFSTVNAPANPAAFYQSQSGGNLTEITDSVFYRNIASANAYTEANARGVFNAANNNVQIAGTFANNNGAPIVDIVRGAPFTGGGAPVLPVIGLDPRPANDALVSVNTPPIDGFFTANNHRGAFAPGTEGTWLAGWTASEAFGFTNTDLVGDIYCQGGETTAGDSAEIRAVGSTSVSANNLRLEVTDVPASQFGLFFMGVGSGFVPGVLGAGDLCMSPVNIARLTTGPYSILQASSNGVTTLDLDLTQLPAPNGLLFPVSAGDTRYFQLWFRDGFSGANSSDAVEITFTN